MCLSLYLGTSSPLPIPTNIPIGSLGIAPATWTPPPLVNHPHVYYLGRKGQGADLECSCLVVEHVSWTESGPVPSSDDLYPEQGPCPFDQLRQLCELATKNGMWTTIVTDDGGGVPQECDASDYCSGFIRLEQIARGNLIFSDVDGGFPWRALHVVDLRGEPITKRGPGEA